MSHYPCAFDGEKKDDDDEAMHRCEVTKTGPGRWVKDPVQGLTVFLEREGEGGVM